MKRLSALIALALISPYAFSSGYEDCILQNMKGVQSEAAAARIAAACRSRENERISKKFMAIGHPMDRDSSVSMTVNGHDGNGYGSLELRNNTKNSTITYVSISVNYFDEYTKYPKQESNAENTQKWGEKFDEIYFKRKSAKQYAYKLNLTPNKRTRLKFPELGASRVSVQIQTLLGRKTSVFDSVANFIAPEYEEPSNDLEQYTVDRPY